MVFLQMFGLIYSNIRQEYKVQILSWKRKKKGLEGGNQCDFPILAWPLEGTNSYIPLMMQVSKIKFQLIREFSREIDY